VQPETVLHLAALTGSASPDEPMVMYGINMTGTMHVLEAARKAAVKRLVFASTRTVYPEFAGTAHGAPAYTPVTEDHWLGPDRPYETWKAAAEHMGVFYRRRFGLEFAAFRFAIYYAAERTLNPGGRAMGLIHQLIRNAVTGETTYIPGGRDQAMDCIYAADIANAFRRAVEAESMPSTAYNIGFGARVTPADFVAAVRAAVPDTKVEIGDGEEFAEGHYCVLDIGRARLEIGFDPKFPLAAGVADCIRRTRDLLASIDSEAKGAS
jgi:nucleoside-diphosphate-sugar epimerase